MTTEPTPQVGFLAQPSYHRIDTSESVPHILAALDLAQRLDGVVADGQPLHLDGRTTLPIMALDRAADLLQQAAFMLRDQRHRAAGWPAI